MSDLDLYGLSELLADGVLDGGQVIRGDDGEILPDTGNDSAYPADFQQLAFKVWAFEAGEDIGATVRILEERTGLRVAGMRIRRWRDSGDWGKISGLVHQKLASSSPGVVRRILSVGTVKAVSWMVQALDDPAVPAASKVKISMGLLDRGGFPIVLRGELFTGISSGGDTEYADLADDELEAAFRAYSTDAASTEPYAGEPNELAVRMMDTEARVSSRKYATPNRDMY
jgi:hypothetical protein